MGVYPCRYCGALFISVNMSQEAHAPNCPAEYINKLETRVARLEYTIKFAIDSMGVDLPEDLRARFKTALEVS